MLVLVIPKTDTSVLYVFLFLFCTFILFLIFNTFQINAEKKNNTVFGQIF